MLALERMLTCEEGGLGVGASCRGLGNGIGDLWHGGGPMPIRLRLIPSATAGWATTTRRTGLKMLVLLILIDEDVLSRLLVEVEIALLIHKKSREEGDPFRDPPLRVRFRR